MTRFQIAGPARWNLLIAAGILALHVALIWALHNGLQIRSTQMLVPVELLSELRAPPAPPSAQLPASPTPKPSTWLNAGPQPLKAAALPPLLATSPVLPAAEASLLAVGKATSAQEAAPEPVATGQTAATPPSGAAPALQLPSSNADYLHNPKPAYPPLSARLGEAGRARALECFDEAKIIGRTLDLLGL